MTESLSSLDREGDQAQAFSRFDMSDTEFAAILFLPHRPQRYTLDASTGAPLCGHDTSCTGD
jgi:hypothetical protein